MVSSRCFLFMNLISAMVQFTVAISSCALVKNKVSNMLRPEDIAMLDSLEKQHSPNVSPKENATSPEVDCLGLGSIAGTFVKLLHMKPDTSANVTLFYFHSRSKKSGVQIVPGPRIDMSAVDFNTSRKTVVIVHGFLSKGNALWVESMAKAYLLQEDVNVIAVDWSAGANTFKYWKAVANTRKVGQDIYQFLFDLKKQTGKPFQKMHLIGHSLGAHIVGFVSKKLKDVYRITGLDPALPCFETNNIDERLDGTDAEFVDIIHTNGREWYKGFGIPTPIGHADFYPNGGMKQPGCEFDSNILRKCYSIFTAAVVEAAICSHSRSQELFTETLRSKNCFFNGYKWDLTYDGVNSSLKLKPSTVMGLKAEEAKGIPSRGTGTFLVVTSDKEPYCGKDQTYLPEYLLKSLRNGFNMKGNQATKKTASDTGSTQNSLFKPFLAMKNFIG